MANLLLASSQNHAILRVFGGLGQILAVSFSLGYAGISANSLPPASILLPETLKVIATVAASLAHLTPMVRARYYHASQLALWIEDAVMGH